jgi:hypothetical protein
MLRQNSSLISRYTGTHRALIRCAALGAIAAIVCLCIIAAESSTKGISPIPVVLQYTNRERTMLYWNEYEDISPFRGEDVAVYHDGWKQRM